jgi:hypothetical protein
MGQRTSEDHFRRNLKKISTVPAILRSIGVSIADKLSKNPRDLLWRSLSRSGRHLELGDALIFIYIAAFVRQYLWFIGNNPLAWVLTFLLSAFLWFAHLRSKDPSSDRTPAQFWLIVALPLFVIYMMRAAFPDTSFDVLDYRLMNGERALRGFPFIGGDFFPARFPFNPAPDMVTGIARHVLGYRLGTVINYFVLLWTGTILNRLLARYITQAWLRCLGVLLILLTEHALFLINNYMVDLLALPLLLEAARLSTQVNGDTQTRTSVRVGLFLGASVAFKLTNLAFALPIFLAYVYSFIRAGAQQNRGRHLLFLVLSFVAPLFPFTLYIYLQTRNPIFPLYNKIFQSPFWPTTELAGKRWGPIVDDPRFDDLRWWEVLIWPLLLPFKVENTAGDLGRHAGRICLAFIASLITLMFAKNNREVRALAFIGAAGAVLWSSISGMHRYGIYLELIGGVALFYLLSQLFHLTVKKPDVRAVSVLRATVVAVLVAQSIVSCAYVYRFEWGSRPSFFENPRAFQGDSKYFLRDYSLSNFLPSHEKAALDSVQAWAQASALESGVQAQLNPSAPALCLYMPEFFGTDAGRKRFTNALHELEDRAIYALCRTENFHDSVSAIKNAGFDLGEVKPIVVPYFSDYARLHMVLIKLVRAGDQNGQLIEVTKTSSNLPDFAMRAELSWTLSPPFILRAGLKETIYVTIKNLSNSPWPSLGRGDGAYRISLGNHWLNKDGTVAVNDDGRTPLLFDIAAGSETELPLTVTAPQSPGEYILEVDMLQEGVAWFGTKGSSTLTASIKVE